MTVEVSQTITDHYFGQKVDVVWDGKTGQDRADDHAAFVEKREEDMYLGVSGYDEHNHED